MPGIASTGFSFADTKLSCNLIVKTGEKVIASNNNRKHLLTSLKLVHRLTVCKSLRNSGNHAILFITVSGKISLVCNTYYIAVLARAVGNVYPIAAENAVSLHAVIDFLGAYVRITDVYL